jgi:glutamate-1-semialdehyde 2,1-aminomutase
MATGIATLELLEDGSAYGQLEALGARLEAGLAMAAKEAGEGGVGGVPVSVQRVGSMITPFFVGQAKAQKADGTALESGRVVRNYADALACDTAAYARFFRVMLDGGIMLPPSQFEAWFISTAHTEGDIDATIEVARAAFKAAKAG